MANDTLANLLEASARRWPQHIAVQEVGAGITYADLETRANQFCRALLQHGVARGMRVGIHAEKSIATVIAIYGILKAGAAYVPLHPALPAARLDQIIRGCDINYLYVDEARAGNRALAQSVTHASVLLGVSTSQCLALAATCVPWRDIDSLPGDPPGVEVDGTDLAYILYTSGTTGQPKGIVHSHCSALGFVDWSVETFRPHAGDRFSNHAPFHFDLSIFDLFVSSACGASVLLIPEAVSKLPASVAELIEEHRITVWYSVPFALTQLLQRGGLDSRDLSDLRLILFAGEQAFVADVDRLRRRFPEARLANLYGPTETNVCTWYEVPPVNVALPATIPIGTVCKGTRWALLDRESDVLLQQGRGELLIDGPTVMAGYWNAPERNGKAFYDDAGNRRFYRTGDLVEADPTGNLTLIGRYDRQVKVRGYRIELEEVEQALSEHEAVYEATVFVEGSEMPVLIAAVTLRQGHDATASEIRKYLSGRIPLYAVPANILFTTSLPRTLTGKVDRLALTERAG